MHRHNLYYLLILKGAIECSKHTYYTLEIDFNNGNEIEMLCYFPVIKLQVKVTCRKCCDT